MSSSSSSSLFHDRIDAAQKLVEKLVEWLNEERQKEEERQQLEEANKGEERRESNNLVILAIPRGGVIIGDIVATMLDAKLDIVVSRKVGAPFNPELAIGAVMPDGSFFPNENIINIFKIPQQYIAAKIEAEVEEIERRLVIFRGSKQYDIDNLKNKTVILVDDGIATGATILAAAEWLRKNDKINCKKLVLAVPVAPVKIKDTLEDISDKVVILCYPKSFNSVGQFYETFPQISDREVKEIMERQGYA
jgi:putative phosphoribosyl transferase